jgi:hypothetical protein
MGSFVTDDSSLVKLHAQMLRLIDALEAGRREAP